MKYPLDKWTFIETVNHLILNEKSQSALVQEIGGLLEQAMDCTDDVDMEWYRSAETLLKELHALKMYHESRRFNENTLRQQHGFESSAPSQLVDINEAPEDTFGEGEMTEQELERHFKEKRKSKKPKDKPKTLKQMSLEEIEDWEKAQDNSNDIYKISARVKNLARGPGMSLTPQGDMLCNSYTHVMKAFYDFAEKIEDKAIKISLIDFIRTQEGMPGGLISAAGVGVTKGKDSQ